MCKKIVFSVFFGWMASAVVPARAAQDLNLQPSSVLFLHGTSTLHDFDAHAKRLFVSAKWLDPAGGKFPATAQALAESLKKGARLELQLIVFVASLDSGKEGLNKNMHKELKVDRHPEIRFTLEAVEFPAQVDLPQQGYGVVGKGKLEIAGVTRETDIPGKIRFIPGGFRLFGVKELKMTEFGIKPPTLMLGAVKTADEVQIHFDLRLEDEKAASKILQSEPVDQKITNNEKRTEKEQEVRKQPSHVPQTTQVLAPGGAQEEKTQEEISFPASDFSVFPSRKKEPEIFFRFDTVGTWQALEQRNDAGTLPDLTDGFQAAQGNLHVFSSVSEEIDVYAEFYLSSKHHMGELTDREGFVLIKQLPEVIRQPYLGMLFDFMDLKIGHFEVDFGDQHRVRSDNAQVQKNPLIGNYVADPNTVEAGVEAIFHLGSIQWLFGLGNGGTTEDFQPGKRYSRHAKFSLQPVEGVRFSGSYYQADQSANPTGYPASGSFSELFSGNRSGSRYSAVVDGTADSGQPNFGNGQKVSAWQWDGRVQRGGLNLSGLFGRVKDDDLNGNAPEAPREDWKYYGIEGKVNMTTAFYVAARYSAARAVLYGDQPMNARIERWQGGAGVFLTDQMLLKLEYVNQYYRNFETPLVSRPDYSANPKFNGILVELSLAFGKGDPTAWLGNTR